MGEVFRTKFPSFVRDSVHSFPGLCLQHKTLQDLGKGGSSDVGIDKQVSEPGSSDLDEATNHRDPNDANKYELVRDNTT